MATETITLKGKAATGKGQIVSPEYVLPVGTAQLTVKATVYASSSAGATLNVDMQYSQQSGAAAQWITWTGFQANSVSDWADELYPSQPGAAYRAVATVSGAGNVSVTYDVVMTRTF